MNQFDHAMLIFYGKTVWSNGVDDDDTIVDESNYNAGN